MRCLLRAPVGPLESWSITGWYSIVRVARCDCGGDDTSTCLASLSERNISDHLVQIKNEVVIWDRIVRRKEEANINFTGKNKYNFRDLSTTFKYVS